MRRIEVDPEEIRRVAGRLRRSEDLLTALRRLVLGAHAEPWTAGLPGGAAASLQRCASDVKQCWERSQELAERLERLAERVEEVEDETSREMEYRLSEAMEPLLRQRAFLERCRAYRVQAEVSRLSLGGTLPPDSVPGIVPLEHVARFMAQG